MAHVVLAGIWLRGVIFTTAVVSPALKVTKWSEAERVGALGDRQAIRLGRGRELGAALSLRHLGWSA